MKLIDITVPLHPNLPVWPGGPQPSIIHKMRMSDGEEANVTHLNIGSHTGTHIDAPLHFVDGGKTTLEIPLEKLVGPCQVVDFRGKTSITSADLAALHLPEGTEKLLFKTDNSRLWDDMSHPFNEDFCALTADAAQWVVDNGIHLVGIDYLSIQLYHDSFETHVILLSKETVIVEGLDLREVEPGAYRLICLPLKIAGVEGTLARAILEQA
ncbi:MAG: cyclase family protein [Saprospiraceae bacterium]|nr:cyclase family protein [Saprospiraceae bacterium]MCF8252375.1 cyclase family protein [Saprospiraceae bacterium]MCF8282216.1 cyclase family protein [Bacteroidales bacterium]MCF8311833.1 cyclase family protein [Saprospiraceae bacterium]MCF8442677.1 cyclase family protein [Saprospiraceae bacterium]